MFSGVNFCLNRMRTIKAKIFLWGITLEFDDWVCLEAGEDDYVIARFEVRVKEKNPLVLNKLSYSKFLFVTQQYLNIKLEPAKQSICEPVLDTPDPLSFDEYWRTREVLKKHFAK
ncbi:hypothetical protein VIS19158_23322 [Vibrio scophthalmi LMG 19158]|uniref:Uncharacterized protein n=2 Tax=Vibrio scophthalmi TaxID=45658 RepID=F9RQJ0_9VIBR|nr:hypothetical protein VIS19158_23322 [Vibrio scophthalmi LMG 19158]